MSSNGKALLTAALGGILAGLAGCAGSEPAPQVPGAPATDPAGVPATHAAEPKATEGDKHACAAHGSCGGMMKDGDPGKSAPEKKEEAPKNPGT